MHKIINDPVHGFITIKDELIYQIIAHPDYQRLRRIKQMALAYLVYPGAVHTRLHHSLGAYHLMTLALNELRLKGTDISDEEFQAAQLAILLHDIGHGPFSHALEHSLVDMHHEELSLMIMERLNDQFNGQFDMAMAIFKGTYPKKFLHQLVSSQLDVDRLDYLARDSFFTGVSEGVIGYDRIIKMLCVKDDQLLIEEKGIHSAENFLIARRLMYMQVYMHKTVLSSELMLVNILKRAKELSRSGQKLFATPALDFFLNHESDRLAFEKDGQCLKYFLELDDSDINAAIKVWSRSEDVILSDLCERLLSRKLFKVVFSDQPDRELFAQLKKQIQSQLNLDDKDLHYYLMQEVSSNQTYHAENERIRILFKNGTELDISEVDHSLIHAGLLVPVKKHYICYLKYDLKS
ncbi:MAG: HD domain-containing protein [Chitinophagaceae bacterium]